MLSWNNWNFCSFLAISLPLINLYVPYFQEVLTFEYVIIWKQKFWNQRIIFFGKFSARGSWNLSFAIGWWSFVPQTFLQMSSHCLNTAKSTLSGNFFFRLPFTYCSIPFDNVDGKPTIIFQESDVTPAIHSSRYRQWQRVDSDYVWQYWDSSRRKLPSCPGLQI